MFITTILSFFFISANPLEFGRVSKKCHSPQPPATFCLRAEAPPPARIIEGRTPKKNVLSIFRKNWLRANPKSKEHFFFLVSAEAMRGGGGEIIRAYASVSLHHALRAWCLEIKLYTRRNT